MDVTVNRSKLLMSDSLRGHVPELEDEQQVVPTDADPVSVVISAQFGQKATAIVGLLRGVLFGTDPELEVRLQLDEALDVVSSPNFAFLGFAVHHGDREVKVMGPFLVTAVRIDDVNANEGLCTLSFGLKRNQHHVATP